jgi:CheY-like chemotaxis protein
MPTGGILMLTADNVLLDEQYARMHLEAKPGAYVAMTIWDTGTGIPGDILDKIFDPFFTTKEPGKGTGLGLTTVHAIVKNHGGFVNVYSKVKKGTRFEVYLPAVETGEVQQARKEQASLPMGQGELVLVVDDEAAIRDITVETLELYGYRVLTANDGTEAIAKYAQHKEAIAVVLVDLMMPYMDGAATIQAMRSLDPQVKIILMSGLTETQGIAGTTHLNATAFLPKPYTAERLLRMLNDVLRS